MVSKPYTVSTAFVVNARPSRRSEGEVLRLDYKKKRIKLIYFHINDKAAVKLYSRASLKKNYKTSSEFLKTHTSGS